MAEYVIFRPWHRSVARFGDSGRCVDRRNGHPAACAESLFPDSGIGRAVHFRFRDPAVSGGVQSSGKGALRYRSYAGLYLCAG